MRTLVIHPSDRSTDFLTPIYSNIYTFPDEDKTTILRSGFTKAEVARMIKEHDRVLMMGHGSPSGLFSVGQFEGVYVIDSTMVELLKDNPNNVYIWCNADLFVTKHGLKGFYTGMFISEYSEAGMCNVNAYSGEIEKSNDWFADVVGSNINEDIRTLWLNTKKEYNLEGAVCDYNRSRLYLAD